MNVVYSASNDYYELLGVSSHASMREMRNAFRELVKKFHPDLHQRTPSYSQTYSHERLRNLISAYRTLSDPELRRQYNINRAARLNRKEFNFRDFLMRRPHDYASQARLLFYDLLHDNLDSAIALYERCFSKGELKKYMSRGDYMDCTYLLSEAYESYGRYRSSWLLLADIAAMELSKPYFKHFFIEIQEGLQRIVRKRLKKKDASARVRRDLRVLLKLNAPRRSRERWRSFVARLDKQIAKVGPA